MDSTPGEVFDVYDIDDLLKLFKADPRLEAIESKLAAIRPALVLIATMEGTVLDTEASETWSDPERVASLAVGLGAALAQKRICLLELPSLGEACALGIRCSWKNFQGWVGCVVARRVLEENKIDDADEIGLASIIVTALGAAFSHRGMDLTRLNTRIQHLSNERAMLRSSHAEALATALEERDTRLREQEEHMHELKRLHLQNQMILNSAGEGILGIDCEGVTMFINPAGARMLGYEVEELIGKPSHETFHHSYADGRPYPRSECPILRFADCASINPLTHEVFWRKDGSSFPVEFTSTVIREGERILGAVVTFRDMTERRHLEAQLRQAQKLESIGQLAAGIAHEINTPTQYIGDNTRFLQDTFSQLMPLLDACEKLREAKDPSLVPPSLIQEIHDLAEQADLAYLREEIPKAIGQSLEGVHRVATIVRSMKEFSHPGGEEKQAIDLNRAIESTITVSRNEWKYVADMVTQFDPNLPLVTCLPNDINQVILNLIINATHAIADKLAQQPGQKGQITVATYHKGDWVEIQVRDTGTGIPEAIRSRIYDPFFTTKPVGRGTGQGLAIAHTIVKEKHGGTIHFETECGKGTTFFVRLPLRPTISSSGGPSLGKTCLTGR